MPGSDDAAAGRVECGMHRDCSAPSEEAVLVLGEGSCRELRVALAEESDSMWVGCGSLGSLRGLFRAHGLPRTRAAMCARSSGFSDRQERLGETAAFCDKEELKFPSWEEEWLILEEVLHFSGMLQPS